MQQLCNLMRPVQARHTLLHTLGAEVEERRRAAQELRCGAWPASSQQPRLGVCAPPFRSCGAVAWSSCDRWAAPSALHTHPAPARTTWLVPAGAETGWRRRMRLFQAAPSSWQRRRLRCAKRQRRAWRPMVAARRADRTQVAVAQSHANALPVLHVWWVKSEDMNWSGWEGKQKQEQSAVDTRAGGTRSTGNQPALVLGVNCDLRGQGLDDSEPVKSARAGCARRRSA